MSLATLDIDSSAIEPVPIILETDMTVDVDDVGALAVLHALADNGEANILGINFNEVHADGVAAIRAINNWYGRQHIPIGRFVGSFNAPDKSKYLRNVAQFPHSTNNTPAEGSLALYRNSLPQQQDHSVVIVSIGFLNSLSEVMHFEPELLRRKVKRLVVMGGRNNDNFNFTRHNLVDTTQRVIEHWPTPMVISDFGHDVKTGAALASAPTENPVREAYFRWFEGRFEGRASWDQIAVLFGVRGTKASFELHAEGEGQLKNGFTWEFDGDRVSYLHAMGSINYYAELIENLMNKPPKHRP